MSEPTPLHLPEVTGPVVVRSTFLGRPTVLVDGRPARRLGGPTYELPTRRGAPRQARVLPGRRMSPYPRLVLDDGSVHETGPEPPLGLSLLAVVPGLAVFLGGLGIVVALAGLAGTLAVLRLPWSVRARYAAVSAVVLVCAGLGLWSAHLSGWL